MSLSLSFLSPVSPLSCFLLFSGPWYHPPRPLFEQQNDARNDWRILIAQFFYVLPSKQASACSFWVLTWGTDCTAVRAANSVCHSEIYHCRRFQTTGSSSPLSSMSHPFSYQPCFCDMIMDRGERWETNDFIDTGNGRDFANNLVR